ncbi:hypothetical protein ABTY98_16270 [Streptomyces sp. NPDC096040]|uniref:hypothetical protein n=1 Tax=Streptomyces sp. NPDC096040 TaxID=3155541 RepID=UPI003324BEB9
MPPSRTAVGRARSLYDGPGARPRGSAVRLTDVHGDGRAELTASARNEDGGVGAVRLFRSTASGITADGSRTFTGTTLGGPSGKAHFGDILDG